MLTGARWRMTKLMLYLIDLDIGSDELVRQCLRPRLNSTEYALMPIRTMLRVVSQLYSEGVTKCRPAKR